MMYNVPIDMELTFRAGARTADLKGPWRFRKEDNLNMNISELDGIESLRDTWADFSVI